MQNKKLHPIVKGLEKDRTVAHNCHIKTKCANQTQITHIEFKSLTVNSNHSQQIQIAHSNYKSTTANYKSFTSNTNRSQQIQIAHSKYKYGQCKRGLQTADCGLRTRGKSRLRVKYKLQTKGKIQNGDHRLGVKCRMKSADCRPGGK